MKTYPKLLALAAAAALSTALVPASAREVPAPHIDRGTVNGHAYQDGGIGKDQRARMAREAQRYDLHLFFSEGPRHAALSDVKLDIFDPSGRDVFSLADAGPRTDVQLPPGRYRVVASAGGIERSTRVDVAAGKVTSADVHWANDPARG